MLEIERKFLIANRSLLEPLLVSGKDIEQGYVLQEKGKSCRVRIKENSAYLTLKFGDEALVRAEFEYEIPLIDGQALVERCSQKLSKTRYLVTHNNNTWEIDVFHGRLKGLILAEIELSSINQSIDLPDWIGEEVTHDPFYLNINLINLKGGIDRRF